VEDDPGGECVVRVVRALQKHNAVVDDAVTALGKALVRMAEEALDDNEMQTAAEQACNLLDQIFAAGGSEDEEDDEGSDE